MLTLRGDAHKYDVLTGKTVAGERVGRPLRLGLDGWEMETRGRLAQIVRFIDLPLGESEAATQSRD